MLNKFSNVKEDGTFESDIKSSDQRFGLQLGALSSGRILLMQGAMVSLSSACQIAIRYSTMRTQFGKPGSKEEVSLIDYPLHQYRLFPLVANVFATFAGIRLVISLWGKNQKRLFLPNNPKLAEVHALISSIKAISTWSSYKGINECR